MNVLLSISLLLNCLLLLLVAWPARPGARDASFPQTPGTNIVEVGQGLRPARRGPPRMPATPWSAIETADAAKLIANLRALGCPEQTIRHLITLRVCRDYRDRLLALNEEALRSWNITRNRSHRDSQEFGRNQRELRTAMEGELERLLGVPAAQLKAAILGWPQFGPGNDFLSLDKQGQLRTLNQRYQALTEEARQELLPWESDPDVDLRIGELNRQKQAELATLLTPEELAALNLRDSPAAKYALKHLPEAKSETEFQRMVQAVEAVGIEEPTQAQFRFMAQPNSDTANKDREYEEKKAQLEAMLKQVLGEKRAAEQEAEEQARLAQEADRERQQDEQKMRSQMVSLADSVGVSADDANRFVDRLNELKPAMEKKFADLEKSLDGTPEKSKAMQDAVQAELEKIAVEMLGEKGRALVQKIADGKGVKR